MYSANNGGDVRILYRYAAPSANDVARVTNVHDKASRHALDMGSKNTIIQRIPTPTDTHPPKPTDTHPQTQIIHIIFIRTRTS